MHIYIYNAFSQTSFKFWVWKNEMFWWMWLRISLCLWSMRAQWLQQSQEAKQGTALCVGYCNSAGCSLKLVELPNVDQRLGFFFLWISCRWHSCFGDLSGVVVARTWLALGWEERLYHCLAGTDVAGIAHPAQHLDGLSPEKAKCVIVVMQVRCEAEVYVSVLLPSVNKHRYILYFKIELLHRSWSKAHQSH